MAFFSSTALGPENPLFRGRQAELARLVQLCQDDVSSYIVVYGGRQNGKTSLLMRLEARLTAPIKVCRVDFQQIQGAPAATTFAFLAMQLAEVLPLTPQPQNVANGPALLHFLNQALARPDIPRLVLLLDELGALPVATREALANALRSLFHARLVRPALAKLQIVFSGGIELYNLIVTEASSLHNICEELYLSDLMRGDAIGLIADGLRGLGCPAELAEAIGAATYTHTAGHPYLTQRIGSLLEAANRRSEPFTPALVEQAVAEIGRGGPLLRQIRDDLREQQLEDAARLLLSNPPRFTRLNDQMARLELIGLAKRSGDRWAPRNPLLAGVFGELLGIEIPASVLPIPVAAPTIVPPVEQLGDVQINQQALRQLLVEHFNDSELRDLCFDLNIDYENLAGQSKADKARELVTYAQRRTRLPELIARAQKVRPQANWGAVGGIITIVPPVTLPQAQQPVSTPVPADARHTQTADEPLLETLISKAPPTRRSSPSTHPSSLMLPELVKVPAGRFLMGSSDADKLARDNEKPQHTLELPDFWIGRTLVTNTQFQPFVAGDGYTNQSYWTKVGWQWRGSEKLTKPLYWDDQKWNGVEYPVVGVSWYEAVAYCRWLSAQTGQLVRLPSEAEWEKAARGTDGRIWPWGNTWDAKRINSKEAKIEKTTPVGQYPTGASPYDALDMAGNVWEWVATKWGKSYPYQLEDEWTAVYLDANDNPVIRGGSWNSEQKLVRGAYRIVSHARDRYDNLGLRVASHSLGQ